MKMEDFNLNQNQNSCMDYKRRIKFLMWLKKVVKSKKKDDQNKKKSENKNSSINFSFFKYIRLRVNNLDYNYPRNKA